MANPIRHQRPPSRPDTSSLTAQAPTRQVDQHRPFAVAEHPASEAHAPSQSCEGRMWSYSLRRITHVPMVLVVEHNRRRGFSRPRIEASSYRVDIATDGLSGLVMAAEKLRAWSSWISRCRDVDGIDVVHQLRRHSAVPILRLTKRGAVADRVQGPDAGGDDCLIKPFGDLASQLIKPFGDLASQLTGQGLQVGTCGRATALLWAAQAELLELTLEQPQHSGAGARPPRAARQRSLALGRCRRAHRAEGGQRPPSPVSTTATRCAASQGKARRYSSKRRWTRREQPGSWQCGGPADRHRSRPAPG